MDVFIDDLLTQERVADLILPRLTRRDVLEEKEGLAPRTSRLEEAIVGAGARSEDEDEGAQSDDSLRELRAERKRRVERARAVREKLGGAGAMDVEQKDDEEAYQSQEESEEERFVSRSPSRSGSEAGYVSRSPSRSPERGGYVSRSPSRSPDRS